MVFNSAEEKLDLIKSFEEKCLQLEKEKSQENGVDKNYNCKVIFDTRTEYDKSVEGKDELKYNGLTPFVEFVPTENGQKISGEIYVIYIRQPRLLDTIKILDAGEKDKVYAKLWMAWDAMVDKKETSPEFFTDRIKLGYLPFMLNHIDRLAGDSKKK